MNFTPDFFALGLVWYVVFLLSTTCHEAAHALAAKWGGDETAFLGGQVTLNPLPHMRREVFGMVVFPVLTYLLNGWMMGWASAPYDPNWSREHPRQAARMALAGPAANFLLAILAGVAIAIGLRMHVFTPPDGIGFASVVDGATPGVSEALARLLGLTFSLNIMLGTFNLLPVPTIYGFNAIPLFLPEAQGRKYLGWAASARTFSLVGLIIAWQVYGRLFGPIFMVAVRALYS